MKYSIYVRATGEITDNIITGNPHSRIKSGEGFVDGWFDPALYQVVDGEAVQVAQPPEEDEFVIDHLRAHRDALLAQSDWTQMPDSPLSESDREAYRQYRQALRDVPLQYSHIEEVENWPQVGDYQ